MKNLKVKYKVVMIGLAIVFGIGLSISTVAEAEEKPACSCDGMVTEFQYYMTSARLGSSEAMAQLGYLYYLGKGVEKSYEDSFVWLTIASLRGHSKAAEIAALVMIKLTPEQIESADLKIATITGIQLERTWM